MTTISPDTTLAEVVTGNPRLAAELERRGLDYCCGGARTLDQACTAEGLDAEVVVTELAALAGDSQPAAWASLRPSELVTHIVTTHHAYLWDELPRLEALVDKITIVHGDRHPELHDVQRVFRELRADLEPHLLKEERVLFPLIAQAESGQPTPMPLSAPIAVMLSEHDRAGELLAELRELTNGYEPPADGCASYRACYSALDELEGDTHLHVHKENNVLFPGVVALQGS
jgi:regulator of cell morphogenesis and NO signaling